VRKGREKRIENLAKEVGVSREEVWGIVEFVLSDMYCLARDCARDEVVRKFVAPALELIMLDKALRGEFDREEALLIFGEMYATAVAGDGHVGPDEVELTVGGELGGGAALLRLATLHLLNQLLPDELKFNVRIYVARAVLQHSRLRRECGEVYAPPRRLCALGRRRVFKPQVRGVRGGGRVEVRVDNIRLTESGNVAADLTISEGGVAVKYNVYLREMRSSSNSTRRTGAAPSSRPAS
jgi:hypothetical protein